MIQTVLVSGAAGFVGPNLIESLLGRGFKVIAIDDLSRGNIEHLKRFNSESNFLFRKCDCSDQSSLQEIVEMLPSPFARIDEIFHLAANSDILAGVDNGCIDLKDTFLTTFELLQLCKQKCIRKFSFASSSAVYGDHGSTKISELTSPMMPVSNYGAMKLASEAIISAACESFIDVGRIFRFPNVVGVPSTHGVIYDLITRIKSDCNVLKVLGDGSQKKSYLHVSDLIDAMQFICDLDDCGRVIYNIGPTDEGVTVAEIAELIVQHLAPDCQISYAGGSRGWVGDVPRFSYSVEKLQDRGWTPKRGSRKAVELAVSQIATQLADA